MPRPKKPTGFGLANPRGARKSAGNSRSVQEAAAAAPSVMTQNVLDRPIGRPVDRIGHHRIQLVYSRGTIVRELREQSLRLGFPKGVGVCPVTARSMHVDHLVAVLDLDAWIRKFEGREKVVGYRPHGCHKRTGTGRTELR